MMPLHSSGMHLPSLLCMTTVYCAFWTLFNSTHHTSVKPSTTRCFHKPTFCKRLTQKLFLHCITESKTKHLLIVTVIIQVFHTVCFLSVFSGCWSHEQCLAVEVGKKQLAFVKRLTFLWSSTVYWPLSSWKSFKFCHVDMLSQTWHG